MRLALYIVGVVTVACLLAGSVAGLRTRQRAADQQVTELNVWDWWSPTSSEDFERYFDELKQRFEQDHPNIRVHYQFVPFRVYVQKLTTAYCGPNPPDVFQCSASWAQTFWERGVLLDLTELVEQTPELGMDRFLTAATRHNQLDGHIFGIPIIVDAEALIYNLDMFEKAGLPTDPYAIKSWDDLRRFAKALTGSDEHGKKVYGFAFSGYGPAGMILFGPMLFANGGEYWTPPPHRTAFAEQPGLEAIHFLRQLYYDDRVCPTFSPQLDIEAEFYAERVAMLCGGTWSGKYIDRNTGSYLGPEHAGGLRYHMTSFPPGPSSKTGQRSTMSWGNMLVISGNSRHKKEAWEFIKLAAGLEGSLMRLKHINQNAARRDFYTLRRQDMPPEWQDREYPTWEEIVATKPYLANVPEICDSGGKAPHLEREAVGRVFRSTYEHLMLTKNLTNQEIAESFVAASQRANRIYEHLRPR